jgi:geranylgeranyl diphosphate synthase type II
MGIPPEVVERFLEESRERVDRSLDALLPPIDDSPTALHEAMRYAVFSGGKRLRPALAFGASRACESEPDRVLPVATAVELVHAYSLVHDDLPAMDDDTKRRGRPTVHVRFGEATAILVGDALLAEAFGVLATGGVPLETVRGLAEAAGSRALVGGQADDLSFRSEGATEATVRSIHTRKTAGLFRFAVLGAAQMVGARPEVASGLSRFAEHYGLAFQLADDLVDAGPKGAGGPEECSVLAVLPEPAARQRLQEHLRSAVQALEPFPAAADPLRGLAERLELQLR